METSTYNTSTYNTSTYDTDQPPLHNRTFVPVPTQPVQPHPPIQQQQQRKSNLPPAGFNFGGASYGGGAPIQGGFAVSTGHGGPNKTVLVQHQNAAPNQLPPTVQAQMATQHGAGAPSMLQAAPQSFNQYQTQQTSMNSFGSLQSQNSFDRSHNSLVLVPANATIQLQPTPQYAGVVTTSQPVGRQFQSTGGQPHYILRADPGSGQESSYAGSFASGQQGLSYNTDGGLGGTRSQPLSLDGLSLSAHTQTVSV